MKNNSKKALFVVSTAVLMDLKFPNLMWYVIRSKITTSIHPRLSVQTLLKRRITFLVLGRKIIASSSTLVSENLGPASPFSNAHLDSNSSMALLSFQ